MMKIKIITLLFFGVFHISYTQNSIQISEIIEQGSKMNWEIEATLEFGKRYLDNNLGLVIPYKISSMKVLSFSFNGTKYYGNDLSFKIPQKYVDAIKNGSNNPVGYFPNGISFPINISNTNAMKSLKFEGNVPFNDYEIMFFSDNKRGGYFTGGLNIPIEYGSKLREERRKEGKINTETKLREIYALEFEKDRRKFTINKYKLKGLKYSDFHLGSLLQDLIKIKNTNLSENKKDHSSNSNHKQNNQESNSIEDNYTESEKENRLDQERASEIQRETQEKIKIVQETSQKIADGAKTVIGGLAKGYQDGIFNSITLSVGMRELEGKNENGEDLISNIFLGTSYELGIGVNNGGFTLGASFEGGFTGIVGLNWKALPSLISIDGLEVLSLGIGVEFGYGDYEEISGIEGQDNSLTTTESLTFYSPGLYVLFFNDILFLSYNYGWTSGDKTRLKCCGENFSEETVSLKSTYTKIGLGIHINF